MVINQKVKNQEEFDTVLQTQTSENTSLLIIKDSEILEDFVIHSKTVDLSFLNCVFKGDVSFDGKIKVQLRLFNCDFQNINFENSIFTSKFRMQKCVVNGAIEFNNASFEDLCDLYSSEFKKTVIFYKTDFIGNLVLSSAEFHSNVLFTYTLIEKLLILQRTRFRKGLDISLMINNGEIKAFGLSLNDFDTIQDTSNDDKYDVFVSNEGLIPNDNKRETFRILKNQMIIQNDHILAVKYRKLESNVYRRQLLDSITFGYRYKIVGNLKKINLKKIILYSWFVEFRKGLTKIEDFFILLLNFISNDFKNSWLRGFGFTVIVSIVFFSWMLSFVDYYSFGFDLEESPGILIENAYNYFIFLNPLHKISEFENILESVDDNIKYKFYLVDYIARIVISYGIYQTIQAFRKFK